MDFRNNISVTGSRGLRNNNPGNFRPGIAWLGAAGADKDNYLIFSDVTYGLRAMALNLYNNYHLSGKRTLLSFITKYAPAADNNNPAHYAAAVGDEVGLGVDEDMKLDAERVGRILRAMMNVELGQGYSAMISDEDITRSVNMIGKFQLAAIQTGGALNKNAIPVIAGTSILVSVYIFYILKYKK